MITLFVDANLFIQCKDIKSLKWDDLFPNKTLKLLIPRAVQKEIDGFKAQGNGRRSKKAKSASAYFKEILNNEGDFHITSNVSIGFTPIKQLSTMDREVGLDSNKNDDLIIQDILSYQKLYPNEAVTLLTHDSGLMVTAKAYDVTFKDIPECWLLEPESDDKDKKIKDLEKRIQAFEANYPEIEIQAYANNSEVTSPLTLKVMEHPPLSDSEIDALINKIKQKSPMKTNFDEKPKSATSLQVALYNRLIGENLYTPPSEDKILEYKDVLYPNWIKSVRKNLHNLHDVLNKNKNICNINVTIDNTGLTPAENVLFEVKATDNLALYLHSEGDFIDKGLSLPMPPEPPRGKSISSIASLVALHNKGSGRELNFQALLQPSRARDKNSFYWKTKPDILSSTWIRECEEFRHKLHSEEITIRVIPELSNKPKGGKITCSVSARNLPNPINLSVIMKVEYVAGNTYEEAEELIEWLEP